MQPSYIHNNISNTILSATVSYTTLYSIASHTRLPSLLRFYAKLTLLSLAVSNPLTNIKEPSNRAMQRFKCTKLRLSLIVVCLKR